MDGRCRATKRNGEPCKGLATEGDGYCWAHSPAHAEQRQRMASKAGKSKGNAELSNVKGQLQGLADKVLRGELDTRKATAATQALNCLLRAIEIEYKVHELQEVEAQLAELEARAAQGGRRW